jgi:hypothetical protein
MAGAARAFIRRFFDLNPLGQLGLAVLRNGVAVRLTELSGSPEAQVAQLAQYGMDTGARLGRGWRSNSYGCRWCEKRWLGLVAGSTV